MLVMQYYELYYDYWKEEVYMNDMRLLPAGDRALAAEFGDTIDPEINNRVHALAHRIKAESVPGILELVPTFRSLLIHYDPEQISFRTLCNKVTELEKNAGTSEVSARRVLHIPCCYGSHFGPDLKDMEKLTGLTRDEIISVHSSTDYKVYMLGFLPGFVYLGGLDKRIEAPRLSTPRVKIPKGSVGIGGSQTGVYPLDSPGGWRLIGSTPLEFYKADREEPVLCRAGDYIRFEPVSSSDYYDIRQMLLHDTYKLQITE